MGNVAVNPLSEANKFEKLKESRDDVLIVGPSGAGKGYLAKRLHTESSARAKKMFIHVNCASVSPAIFESEMFGHVRGSFTGAFQDKEGYCGKVQDGDLFLDEIGDLPPELQAKLLVLLGDKIYTPVGSCETQNFNGRIIAATNKNLEKEVAEGRFREDLHYRLCGFVLNVGALREKRDSIPELADLFLAEENPAAAFDAPALKYLSEQKWDGNVRQLKSVIKRIARYSCDGNNIITRDDIVPYIEEEYARKYLYGNMSESEDLPALIKTAFSKADGDLHTVIKLFAEHALARNKQNVTAAAQNIGLGRKTLERMLKKYNISRGA
jgi:DNA-binding NtrC family response regulator